MSVLVSALWALAIGSPARAEVFTIPAGDVAALITAINTANGNGEDDTINLEAGTYTLTEVNNNTDAPNGLPSITSRITINGAGAGSTVLVRAATAPQFRIMHVAAAGILTLDGLTVSGGDSIFLASGILNFGIVTLTNSTVSNNTNDGGGETVAGGIANVSGTLTLINSTVSNNRSEDDAAGIANVSGTLTLINSTVSENDNFSGVGGIRNSSGTVTILNSTISNNFSAEGNIHNNGTLTLNNSTMSGNGSRSDGCNFFNSGTLTLINSTISNNRGSVANFRV